MKLFVIAALMLVLVACPAIGVSPPVVSCNQTPEKCGYPLLQPLWTLPGIRGNTNAQLWDSLLINDELNAVDRVVGQVAVHLDRKEVAWRSPEAYEPYSSIIYKNTLIYNSRNQSLKLLSSSGQLLKTIPIPVDDEIPLSNPAQRFIRVGSTLYLNLYRHILAYDLDALADTSATATPLWSLKVASQAGGVMRMDLDPTTDTLYYTVRDTLPSGTETTQLVALNRTDGSSRWTLSLSKLANLAIVQAVPGKVLYSVIGETSIHALDASGKPLWTSEKFVCPGGGTTTYTQLVVQDDTVLAMPGGDHCFSAWNLQTGKRLWAFDSPRYATFDNRPVFLNGVIYAANTRLWAIDAGSGKILSVSEKDLSSAQGYVGTVIYDMKRNLLYVWGDELNAFKPLR